MLKYTVNVKDREIYIDVRHMLQRAGRYMASSTVNKIQNMTSPPNSALTVAIKSGNKPLRDTGQLMSSIHYSMKDPDSVAIGTNRIGARLQNEGGTITAKKAKYLWIPAGRWTRDQLRYSGWSITQLIRRLRQSGYCYQRGNVFYYRKKGSKTATKLFILKKSVHIPQRRFLYFSEVDVKEIDRIFRRSISNGN